jgi:hypothetical protein
MLEMKKSEHLQPEKSQFRLTVIENSSRIRFCVATGALAAQRPNRAREINGDFTRHRIAKLIVNRTVGRNTENAPQEHQHHARHLERTGISVSSIVANAWHREKGFALAWVGRRILGRSNEMRLEIPAGLLLP